MESGPDAPRPSSKAERRARLQELAYGSGSSAEQKARALAALDAIEQEERALIRSRAQNSDCSQMEGRREGWELREADDDDPSPLVRRRPVVILVALLTAVAVGLTAIGAGISLFF